MRKMSNLKTPNLTGIQGRTEEYQGVSWDPEMLSGGLLAGCYPSFEVAVVRSAISESCLSLGPVSG